VAALQAALGEIFRSHSQACQHDFSREVLVLDLDLSPLPASSVAEGVRTWIYGALPLQDGAQTGAGASR
jgi:hypothetical protein